MSKKLKFANHLAAPRRDPGDWSETALRVLNERYLLKDAEGMVIETADEAMWRVSRAVAQAEMTYAPSELLAAEYFESRAEEFYELLLSQRFMPNSPTLMNAGKDNGLQLSACYVVPVPDSLEGIFDAVKHAALIHKSGGGTGMSFSRLRPKNARVGSTRGVSSGPVSFMKIFDAATEHIKQGGSRRGANMGVLRVDHPDILEFIDCKRTGGVVNFNISVGITDKFMAALTNETTYDLVDPNTREVVTELPAAFVWEKIIAAAWATGDPGLIFIDRVNQSLANPTPSLETIESTNPCGEQPLGSYDACNLGSLNLAKYVKYAESRPRYGGTYSREHINWNQLGIDTMTAVRFLDDVIDINPYPLKEVRAKVRSNRRIGLGVMGWADMLFDLGIPYGSDTAVLLGEEIMAHIQKWADTASRQLAVERGAFPNFPQSRYADQDPIRNSNRTTVAPTGTISIIAGCSSGIEPIFALAFQHRVKQPDGTYRVLDFVNPLFLAALDRIYPSRKPDGTEVVNLSREDILTYIKEHGSLAGHWAASDFPAFQTAQEIEPEWHIKMQAAFQKHVDSAISKTVNLPNEATTASIASAYMQAWYGGCLGITVFRDGCKGEQVLNVGVTQAQPAEKKGSDIEEAHAELLHLLDRMDEMQRENEQLREKLNGTHAYAEELEARLGFGGRVPAHRGGLKPRPDKMRGYTRQVRAPEGKVNLTLNSDDEGLFEVFINIGRAGSDVAAMAEAIGRLLSFSLRLDSPMSQEERVHELARQLQSIGGSTSVGFGPQRVTSLPDAVARALTLHLAEEAAREETTYPEPIAIRIESDELVEVAQNGHTNGHAKATFKIALGNLCGSCGNSTLVLEEGCRKCLSCGFSAC